MALNVTTAQLAGSCQRATASPSLVQWDQGQILKITGAELPAAYQVEFCNPGDTHTITQIGDETGVSIPDTLLATGREITAYIVLHEGEEDRETEYWITICVKPRAEPSDYTPDPEQQDAIDEAITALNAGVEAAAGSAEDSEAWAVGERGGVPVGPGDPTYHNNSKYWAEQGGGGGGGTTNYNALENKPQINGHTLSGNQSAADLGLGTYSLPSGGIPDTDLSSDVQASLDKADTALQNVPDTYRTAAAQDLIDQGKLATDGDGSNVTAAFSAAGTRANISTGEKLSVLFGKIAKWFSDLGTAAFRAATGSIAENSTDLVESGAVYTGLAAKYEKPASGIPASDLASGVIPTVPDAATATPSNLGTAAVGSSSRYAREDHVHNKPTASDVGAIASPSSPSDGQFLVYSSSQSAWVAQTVPNANGVSF